MIMLIMAQLVLENLGTKRRNAPPKMPAEDIAKGSARTPDPSTFCVRVVTAASGGKPRRSVQSGETGESYDKKKDYVSTSYAEMAGKTKPKASQGISQCMGQGTLTGSPETAEGHGGLSVERH